MRKSQLLKKLHRMKPDVILDVYFGSRSLGGISSLGQTTIKTLWPVETVDEYLYLVTRGEPLTVLQLIGGLLLVPDSEICVEGLGHFLPIKKISNNGRIDC